MNEDWQSVCAAELKHVHYSAWVEIMRNTSLRARASHWRDEANIRLRRPDWATVITDQLSFGEVADKRFTRAIDEATPYLEYGEGSSTLPASAVASSLVSVESDSRFLKAVESLCLSSAVLETTRVREFLFADIGGTGAWSVSTMKRPILSRVNKWEAYPMASWFGCGLDYRADAFLINGRFRVACALAVVLLQPDIKWTLLFDDYAERPEFWAFEAFADRIAMHGRMAEFQPKANVSSELTQMALDAYLQDWR